MLPFDLEREAPATVHSKLASIASLAETTK
jgi:hypothetical protein